MPEARLARTRALYEQEDAGRLTAAEVDAAALAFVSPGEITRLLELSESQRRRVVDERDRERARWLRLGSARL